MSGTRNLLVLALVLGVAFAAHACEFAKLAPISFGDLMESTARPSIHATGKLKLESAPAGFLSLGASGTESAFLKFLEIAAEEVLTLGKDRPVLLFARDGEGIQDAVETLLLIEGVDASKFKLFNASRLVARGSSPAQLIQYAKEHGTDVDAVLEGRQKVFWLDTGNRGSIYLDFLEAFLTRIPPGDPNWRSKVANLLNGIDARLVASQNTDTRAAVVSKLSTISTFDPAAIKGIFRSSLYFGEVLEGKRASVGIPEDRHGRYRWIVDMVEHRPHYKGRAASLSADGRAVSAYETKTSEAERAIALALQFRTFEHFMKPEVRARYRELLKAYPKTGPPPAPESKPVEGSSGTGAAAETTPKAAAPTLVTTPWRLDGAEWVAGKVVQTPAGRRLKLDSTVHSHHRKVFKAQDVATGESFFVEIAADETPETLEKFAKEPAVQDGLLVTGHPYAKAVELGPDYFVKRYVEGETGKTWFEDWVASGMNPDAVRLKSLRSLISSISAKGWYLRDLGPNSVRWTGKDWVIVDSGTAEDREPEAAHNRFIQKIVHRWAKDLTVEQKAKFTELLRGK